MTCHPKGGQPATQKGGSQPPKRGAASHTKGGQPATQKGGSQPHKRGAASHPIFLEFQAQPQTRFFNPPNSSKYHN